jgi:tRNA (uracil-5-)-methyltransferase
MSTSTVASSPAVPFQRKSGTELVACHLEDYGTLLRAKVNRLQQLLGVSVMKGLDVEVFESPRTNYRMRANFNIWRDKRNDQISNDFYYAMFDDTENKEVCEIKSFPRGSLLMNTLMDQLHSYIVKVPALYEHLFEVRFVTTQVGEACIVMIYKKPLPTAWKAEAAKLAEHLGENVKIIGRSRNVKEIIGGSEDIKEVLEVDGSQLQYFHTEGAFSQPNAKVCEKMLLWAIEKTRNSQDHDLLELYCGGGTFTIAMAKNFRKVFATEMSRASVELAVKAIAANGVSNIKIARCSAEEFSEAYTSKRNLKRFIDAGIDINDYRIETVFVDPPRCGLDSATCNLLSRFDRIVYVSCNPETLARDVGILSKSHRTAHVAAFDQFPYTHHLESGVVLIKKAETLEAIDAADHDSETADTSLGKRKAEEISKADC